MSQNKTITIITGNYFPEDTAIGLYTAQFATHLVSKGFCVKVITGFPNYPQWQIYESYEKLPKYFSETIEGIEIIRYKQYIPSKVTFKGRVLMMLSLFYGTCVNLRKVQNTDLVICIIPFTISVLSALILSKIKKAKLWIHIQDFEFDLALESGIVQNNNLLQKLLKKILSGFESSMLNAANVASSISLSMLAKIKEKSNHTEPYYFPNWVSAANINPETSKQHKYIHLDKFTLLYSGNIGEKQDWNFFIELCKIIDANLNIEIVIVGNGGFKDSLSALIKDFEFVKMYDSIPYVDLNDLLCAANVHFLFQKNEVVDTIMPSKILGMMASAKPSIITGNIKSEVCNIVNQSQGGYYFADNNVRTVYNALLELKQNQDFCKEMGNCARKFILNKFSDKEVLNNFSDKVASLF
jgi:colanic acid biosynthesis glycosyl transferase WcaI